MICCHCALVIGEMPHYRVTHNAEDWVFCGRRCMVEHLVPEVQKAIVPSHWIPTPEEEARMSE
jgi:hypothetical protein